MEISVNKTVQGTVMVGVRRTLGTVINVRLVTMKVSVRQAAQRTVMEHVTRTMGTVTIVKLDIMEVASVGKYALITVMVDVK